MAVPSAPTPQPRTELLVVRSATKRFGPTLALSDVSVSFFAGEVHALMGENGAGKSTLGKAIAGLHKIDSGSITLGGRELVPGSIDDAYEAGIRIVHQELAQCPNLSVAENLCLHSLPTRIGLVDRSAMNRRAEGLLRRLAPEIDVEAPLGTLAPGRRQIVQIAGSLDERIGSDGAARPAARVIVFDEPTSSLSMAEADRLMQIVRRLAADGLLCIYVSHRMGEIFTCCDRVSVLRDGRYVGTGDVKSIDEGTLVSWMIGRTLAPNTKERAAIKALAGTEHHPPAAGPVALPAALEVRSLRSPGKLGGEGEGDGLSFKVRPGEILGVGGLVGAGRSELLDAVFGLDRRAGGEVLVYGRPLPDLTTREAIAAGLGYVPEDRRLQGLFFQLGINENIVSPQMPLLARAGLRGFAAERAVASQQMARFRVKAASLASLPGELSGGNQQKLLIARWMNPRTRVLLLDEPTRGIDVGTKAEIYRIIFEAADSGLAVLLVSSEMPELLALSDRIIVLCEGRLTGELEGERMTQENILRLATQRGIGSPALTAA
ncbi:MAG: sugar ABC transporter ATP-binding protein [Phycisphaerales bacterium]